MAVVDGSLPPAVVGAVESVQQDLFDVGADLCTPVVDRPEYPPLRVEQAYVDRLESACDAHGDPLPDAAEFRSSSGGTRGAGLLHVARTVTRRAERATWAALEAYGDSMNPLAAKYLNRLSDLLFVLSRVANLPEHGGAGDVLWVPGANR